MAQGSALTAECGGWKIMVGDGGVGGGGEEEREWSQVLRECGRASKPGQFFLGGVWGRVCLLFLFFIVLAVSLSGDILVTQKTQIRDFFNMDRT